MKLRLATIGVLAAVTAAPVFAGSTTHNLNVSATVTGNCRFNTAGPTALTIANSGTAIDPSLTGNATGSANVLFRCTTGTTSAITADNGLNFNVSRRVRIGATTNYMPYTLGLTGNAQAGTGHGAGQDKTLAVTGTIAEADYVNATAGAYTDTVVLTITP